MKAACNVQYFAFSENVLHQAFQQVCLISILNVLETGIVSTSMGELDWEGCSMFCAH